MSVARGPLCEAVTLSDKEHSVSKRGPMRAPSLHRLALFPGITCGSPLEQTQQDSDSRIQLPPSPSLTRDQKPQRHLDTELDGGLVLGMRGWGLLGT